MRRILILLFCLLFFSLLSPAQREASIWYFGRNAGLDFSSGSPVLITNGQIYTDEGVASICDVNGNLLFYTEGTTIWNKNHTIMPNGTGLLGSFSSSQSAIIVPKINDPSRYYVFTVDQLGLPNGFTYSIVNMNLAGGLGDVEVKNIPVMTPVCEKLTAVKHCNGKDIWVIVHGWNSDAFYSFLITAAGISATPVVSNTGRFISSSDANFSIGCMKASPDGKKLAVAHKRQGVDLCNFNNTTGVVSNARSVFLSTEHYAVMRGPYGVEFSSNSKLLYISADYFDFDLIGEYSILLQYNVSLPDMPSIQASKKIIYRQQAHWSAENFGSLQMAPDGKIYMAEFSQPYISVINNPDLIGTACQFVHAQVSLFKPGFFSWSTYGLPSFIQSYWRPGFSFRGACNGTFLYFDFERPPEVFSVKWDFGDPASGVNNISTLDSTSHTFSAPGIYTVKLIRYMACANDTVSKQVQAGQLQFNLGNDTLICGNSGYLLNPLLQTGTGYSFLWQDGSSAPGLMADTTGLYWVEIKNNLNGCFKRDSIRITRSSYPQFSLGNDFVKCEGQLQNLFVSVPSASYLWNNGSINNSLSITQTGLYWLDVSMGGCIKRDTVQALFHKYPVVKLGNDTILCEGQNFLLDAANSGLEFLWQNNSAAQTFLGNSPGDYWVKVTNQVCSTTDTINIKYDLKPVFTLGNDTAICAGMTIALTPTVQNGSSLNYLWGNGATSPSITVNQEGLYTLQLSNNCGSKTDEIVIKKGICKIYVPSAFTPNRDGLNDIFKTEFGQDVTEIKLRVFNRWGQLVFETNNIQKGWDGNLNGLQQPNGVYVWTINYKTTTNTNDSFMKGTVLLTR